STRARAVPGLGARPGMLAASIITLSFALWPWLAGVSPLVSALRDPMTGYSIDDNFNYVYNVEEFGDKDVQNKYQKFVADNNLSLRPADLFAAIVANDKATSIGSDPSLDLALVQFARKKNGQEEIAADQLSADDRNDMMNALKELVSDRSLIAEFSS